MNYTQKQIQDSKNIDFGKWMSTDELCDLQNKLQGIAILQDALTFTNEDVGVYANSSLAYEVIADCILSISDKIEALKPKLGYMDSFARVGTDELYRKEHLKEK